MKPISASDQALAMAAQLSELWRWSRELVCGLDLLTQGLHADIRPLLRSERQHACDACEAKLQEHSTTAAVAICASSWPRQHAASLRHFQIWLCKEQQAVRIGNLAMHRTCAEHNKLGQQAFARV